MTTPEAWTELDDSFEDLENAIRNAKDYVLPSENLRPRLLEAVRDLLEAQATSLRLGVCAISIALLSLLSIPGSIQSKPYPIPSEVLLERALQIQASTGCGLDWSLVDCLLEQRSERAKRMGL